MMFINIENQTLNDSRKGHFTRKWILSRDVHVLGCALITKDPTANGGIVSYLRLYLLSQD